jgi:hypothetical protein
MIALPYWALFAAVLLGSAFGQVDSATLHSRYGEPTQEVFTVRPGYQMTVLYGSEHQACRLEISSGQSDSFESSKETNRGCYVSYGATEENIDRFFRLNLRPL